MSPSSPTSDSDEHFAHVYDKLHALAARHFARANAGATLQPTALVHEVYLRLVRQDPAKYGDREHFLAVAATAMRQIMIDRARRRQAAKRGGDRARVTLRDVAALGDRDAVVDALGLDDLLTQLSDLSPRQAQVVEMRVFGGMTVAEIARVLETSASTVEREWRQARAWMRVQIERGAEA
ncbi:MAG: ECF-type sigma factor [Haliangiales bacterium]